MKLILFSGTNGGKSYQVLVEVVACVFCMCECVTFGICTAHHLNIQRNSILSSALYVVMNLCAYKLLLYFTFYLHVPDTTVLEVVLALTIFTANGTAAVHLACTTQSSSSGSRVYVCKANSRFKILLGVLPSTQCVEYPPNLVWGYDARVTVLSLRFCVMKVLVVSRFPLHDPARLQQWLKNMGREGWTPSRHQHICHEHFTPSCFTMRWGIRYLASDAVPTIFQLSENAEVIGVLCMSLLQPLNKQPSH